MSQINVNSEDKEKFDELKSDGQTQAELFAEMVQIYEIASEPTIIDSEDIAEEITVKVASNIELAARRGVKSAQEE